MYGAVAPSMILTLSFFVFLFFAFVAFLFGYISPSRLPRFWFSFSFPLSLYSLVRRPYPRGARVPRATRTLHRRNVTRFPRRGRRADGRDGRVGRTTHCTACEPSVDAGGAGRDDTAA